MSTQKGVTLASGVKISNVWLFEHEGQRFLFDTALRLERPALVRALKQAGLEHGDLDAILLTHRHSDHAGNAAWLRDELGCSVMCHEADARILAGEVPAPALATASIPLWARPICAVEDHFPSRLRIDERLVAGPWRFGFEVFAAPGHTEGSVLYYHAATGTLFSGDVILAGPATMRAIRRLTLADPAFSEEPQRCWAATREFLRKDLPVQTLCSGHGALLTKDVRAKLRALRT